MMSHNEAARVRRQVRHPWGALKDEGGAAAVELAIWAGVMILPILSVVDLGFYLFQRTQLENATQVAAQTVWMKCDNVKVPATLKCPNLNTMITTAIQSSTSLGANVTATSIIEGYYCMNGSSLQATGTSLSNGTTICPNGSRSADYIQITGSYTYTPLFTGVSVTSLLSSPITKTAWMRLN